MRARRRSGPWRPEPRVLRRRRAARAGGEQARQRAAQVGVAAGRVRMFPAIGDQRGPEPLGQMRGQEFDKPVKAIDAEALEVLSTYGFPGNVRELRSALRRAVAYSTGEVLRVGDLPVRLRRGDAVLQPGTRGAIEFGAAPHASLADVRRAYALHVLESCGGNKQQAARILGIGRKTLYGIIEDAGSPSAADHPE